MGSVNDLRLEARALLLGRAGGLRSWPPLGILALNYHTPSVEGSWKRWPVLRNMWGRRVLIALGAAEFVADKLPHTQPRIAPSVQLSRSDGGIFGRGGRPATSATSLERRWSRRAVCPIPVVAVVEGAVAVTLLSAVVRAG